jgi:hypothetical protein
MSVSKLFTSRPSVSAATVRSATGMREVARIVLRIDPDREPDRAREAFESHLVLCC